jgi:hypothetical protein
MEVMQFFTIGFTLQVWAKRKGAANKNKVLENIFFILL